MTEENLSTIVSYPSKRAANEPSRLILLGERLNQIAQDDANYFTYMMQEIIEKIAVHIVEESSPPHSLAAMKKLLSMAFMYCYDKSVETTYKLRVGAKRDVRFSFEDLYHGMGGDRIPVYLQLKVTPVIDKVALVFQDTFDFLTGSTPRNMRRRNSSKRSYSAACSWAQSSAFGWTCGISRNTNA